MKKLIFFFFLSIALISCNRKTTLPPNSIYQEGDVVYKIDEIIFSDYTDKPFQTFNDVEFIYREENSKFIYHDHMNNRSDIRDLYFKESLNNKYKMEDNFTILIDADNIVYLDGNRVLAKHHISEVIEY